MKDKAMNERKIQQNNSAVITPAAFYTNKKDKIKLNWFLFEYAAELDSHIERPLRKRLKCLGFHHINVCKMSDKVYFREK